MNRCIFMVVVIVLQAVALAGVGEDLSNAAFVGEQAIAAREKYNAAVRAAWYKYQAEVNVAARRYCMRLEAEYKKEVAADNLLEALKVRRAIDRCTFDFNKGLVLYMSFDKQGPGGKVLDNSGTGNHGMAEGATWVNEGRWGGAYKFDIKRKTDRIVVGDSDSLDCKTITICAWVKTGDNDEFWNRIVDKDWRKGYCLCMGGDFWGKNHRGKVFFQIDEKSWVGSDKSIADNKWHHIMARYDGEFMELYIDGKLQKNRTKRQGQIPANEYPIGIGGSYPGYDMDEFIAFNGVIGEVMIYNRALSQREIRALREKNVNALFPDKPAGIGIQLGNHPEGVIVQKVFNTSTGLKEGDVIVGADGVSFSEKSVRQVVETIRGPAGSSVVLDVKKPDGTIKKVMAVRRIL